MSIKDVAKLSGFSICTVSRALANKPNIKPETKEKILKAAEELGYKPNYIARSLQAGQTHTFSLILPDLLNVYYPRIAKFISQYAEQKGYMVMLCDVSRSLEKERAAIQSAIERGVDGVIIHPCMQYIAHIQELKKHNIPYVLMNQNFENEYCVPCDNQYGGYQMIKYLAERGHKKICMLFRSFENPNYCDRYLGAMKALDEYGLCGSETILFDIDGVRDTYTRVREILQQEDPPSAVFATNDMMCVGIYSAADSLGIKIPEDLSVVSYDNTFLAEMMIPSVTSFSQSEEELSHTTVDLLIDVIENCAEIRNEKLVGSVIERKSVRCLIR